MKRTNYEEKVLIIEDDKMIAEYLETMLENHEYRVEHTTRALEGISLAASVCPDVILLDLGLPDLDGCDVIRQVRTWSRVPIIVISARESEEEKVKALDTGADDYLTKPFGNKELLARIRTSLRHRYHGEISHSYRSGDLEIDFERRLVRLEGSEVHLTQIEYRLLSILAESSGKVLTYHSIMNIIWGPYMEGSNQILRVNMANIRRKIEKNPAKPQYIFTEAGVGYRMIESDRA